MSSRRALLAFGGLVVDGALGGCAQDGSTTATDEPTEYVTVVDGPWPFHAPPERQDELAHRAAELVDWHSEDLAGSYVDDDGTQVILAATDRGEQLATELLGDRAGTRVDRVGVSLDSANELLDDWAHSSRTMSSWFRGGGYDPYQQAIAVIAVRRPPKDALADLEQRAAVVETPVIVYVDPNAGTGELD